MTDREIFAHVDHTLLRADANEREILALCGEAERFDAASACIPPSYVERARTAFPALNICTVIGFPLGYSAAEIKRAELLRAVNDGADELDVVINIGDVKNGRFDGVERELSTLREAAGGKILKVIVETCFLTRSELISLCGIVTRSGADFIKTSTGYGSAGARLEDVCTMREHIGKSVKIKASGGIRTREAMVEFISAGCCRLGTSSAAAALGLDG